MQNRLKMFFKSAMSAIMSIFMIGGGSCDAAQNKGAEVLSGVNKIEDLELQKSIADLAIAQLAEGKDYTELSSIKCKFGYIFEFPERGVAALLKVTTDKGIFYFAVQGEDLIVLNFDESLFTETVNKFLELHGSQR